MDRYLYLMGLYMKGNLKELKDSSFFVDFVLCVSIFRKFGYLNYVIYLRSIFKKGDRYEKGNI